MSTRQAVLRVCIAGVGVAGGGLIRANVDVVWVATPNHLRTEHAIVAAEHGKHVIVSKPLAITIEQAEAMNEAADRNGVKLMCGHTRSMAASIRTIATMAQSSEFGKLGMVHCWKYSDWMYRPGMPYELDVSQGGGVVFRQGAHEIDIVRPWDGKTLSRPR